MGKEINVEALLLKQDQISNELIKESLATLATEQKEKQKRELLRNLRIVQEQVENAVSQLKIARKVEKVEKNYLTAIANAEAQFLKDANFNAFESALSAARDKRYNDL